MTIIESLSEYFADCPILRGGQIRVDYLGENPADRTVTIDAVPCSPIIRQYADGGTLRQYLFIVGSREYYSEDIFQNLVNNGLYEDLSAWIERQSRDGVFPQLDGGRICQSIEALSTAYLLEENPLSNNARYQIQCRITYTQ